MRLLLGLLLTISLYAEVGVGDRAYAFNLPDLYSEDKLQTLDDFKGRVILLNLWASWCSGCKDEMPEFFTLQKSYSEKDFLIVTVSVDKKKRKSIEFLEHVESQTGIKTPFVTLYDKEKSLAKAYKVMGMPTSYLIDKEGRIARVIVGSLNHDDISVLKSDIDRLLKEKAKR